MKRYFLLMVVSCLLHANSARDNGKVQAYQFCSGLGDIYYRQTCNQVVGKAQFFDKRLFKFCNKFEIYHTAIYCLDQGRNTVLNVPELRACESTARGYGPLGNDELRLLCLRQSGKATQKKRRSVSSVVEVKGWYSYQKAWAAMDRQAVQRCSGWDSYHYENPEWKTKDCWWNEMSGAFQCKSQIYCVRSESANRPSVVYTSVSAKPRTMSRK